MWFAKAITIFFIITKWANLVLSNKRNAFAVTLHSAWWADDLSWSVYSLYTLLSDWLETLRTTFITICRKTGSRWQQNLYLLMTIGNRNAVVMRIIVPTWLVNWHRWRWFAFGRWHYLSRRVRFLSKGRSHQNGTKNESFHYFSKLASNNVETSSNKFFNTFWVE